ncbi:hypothetical protein NMY3_01383 [Candidatus Nitrosocosmicus oleophilus]|jgi:hypothetical protein|uniref:Uncharacterized protein n=1 Tax=Candidatus Nitrosocosmicus oleophilus TaxID=1353260 RepID=A0A654LX52_9ARCH|nr:hypothetical protein [Candidatus Nitrosocosmicus oleophilus]ALI35587.1 hypothetical protein NMY3_01383 [Candidatus Nitrosocosmicus oleophilus]
MAIILQCEKCRQISKKTYCGECKKSIDYFEVFEYNDETIVTESREPIERIKAYTWNDVLNFVRNKYFEENSELNINCEKDFAYIEKKALQNTSNMNSMIDKSGYRIFLNKDIPTILDNSSRPGKLITDIT